MFCMSMPDIFMQRGQHWYRVGDPGHAYSLFPCDGCGEIRLMRRSKPAKFCSQSCASRVKMARRWKEDPKLLAGPNGGMWKGDSASYDALHKRVHGARGKASTYTCVFCDEPARDWAWNNVSDMTDVDSFFPACKAHHRRFDVATRMMDQDPAEDCGDGWTPSMWL